MKTLKQIQDDYSKEMDGLFVAYQATCSVIAGKHKLSIESVKDDPEKMGEIVNQEKLELASALEQLKQNIQISKKAFFKRTEANFSDFDQKRMSKLDQLLEQA